MSDQAKMRELRMEMLRMRATVERAEVASAMRELRGGNRMVAPDRLAVLTALNLAHELQQHSAKAVPAAADGDALRLIDEANRRLDALLAQS